MGLSPWCAFGAINLRKGQSLNQGHSPQNYLASSGGTEPRLTSGGEAVVRNERILFQ